MTNTEHTIFNDEKHFIASRPISIGFQHTRLGTVHSIGTMERAEAVLATMISEGRA